MSRLLIIISASPTRSGTGPGTEQNPALANAPNTLSRANSLEEKCFGNAYFRVGLGGEPYQISQR